MCTIIQTHTYTLTFSLSLVITILINGSHIQIDKMEAKVVKPLMEYEGVCKKAKVRPYLVLFPIYTYMYMYKHMLSKWTKAKLYCDRGRHSFTSSTCSVALKY